MIQHGDPRSHCRLAISFVELCEGEVGILERIELDDEAAQRLKRLGLTPGRRITMVKGGSRCLIGVAGGAVALDRTFATALFVVRESDLK